MTYLVIKSLHIISIVSWFAGLLYIVRLFIYHREALLDRSEPEKTSFHNQFHLMEKRLWYGITTPAMITSLGFGVWMLFLAPAYLTQPWMLLKLFFVFLLIGYHHLCGHIYKKLASAELTWSSHQLRVFNEIGTLFLVAIVFSVVLRRPQAVFISLAITLLVGTLLFFLIKRFRKKS